MSATGLSPLTTAIVAQEQRVREVDQRLRDTLGRARSRLRRRRVLGSRAVWRFGALVGGWLLLRIGRRAPPVPGGVAPDRLSLLLDMALPALAPMIGVQAAAVLTALASVSQQGVQRAPAVAARVDLDLYAGTWYEIARLPDRHARVCIDDLTSTYLREGASLRVVNRWRRANGRMQAVTGKARVVDRHSRAKLRVTFAPSFIRWLPWAWADYWILHVSPDYRRALVGTPDRRYLWLLAREPSIAEPEFRAMRLIAAAQGYDTQSVRPTTAHSVR